MSLRHPEKSVTLPVLLVAFLFSLLPLLRAETEAPASGDAFVTASIADARTLIPLLASDAASADLCGLIFNGLVKYDAHIQLVPDLAERWEIKDDGLVIVFYLRKDVRWHDGVRFTAADVAFTYQKLIDPKIATPYSGDFERVRSLEVIDDYTVRVTYKEPFAPALSSWGMSIIPEHLLAHEDLNATARSRRPIGTGPYTLKSWQAQEKAELVANHDYFEHRPYIDRYIWRVIPDEATIFLELQTEGLDSAGLSPLQFSRQTDTPFFKQHYRKYRLPSFGYTYLGYNLSRPLFNDLRVRRALNYAVDKDELIRTVLHGFGRVSTGPFIPGSWAYNEGIAPVEFNPARAKALLADAGWRRTNSDGWLEKDGQIFSFTITTNQGNEERVKTAQIIQRRLKDIGIKVQIRVVEWSVFLSEVVEARKFDAVLLGWSLSRDPDNYDIWHSSKTRPGEFNFIGYQNAEVDRLLVEARRTFDQLKRQEYYHRIQEILYTEQPTMFLYVAESLSVIHRRFRGIVPAAIGIGYNFIDWWVPRQLQRYNRIDQE